MNGENASRSMTVSGMASDRAMPISVPTTIPTRAPNVDTMIASQRTERRVWRLFIPTAAHQADLTGALEHAERQGDRDAEHGDDDGEHQQHRDREQDLVDLALLVLAELGVRLHQGLRERLHRCSDGGVALLGGDALGEAGDDEEVARCCRRADPFQRVDGDQPVAGERGVLEDAGDGQVSSCRSGTSLDRVAELQVEILCRVLVHEDAAVGERLEVAVGDVDVDELLEGQRVDGAERLLVAVDERRAPLTGVHGGRARAAAPASRRRQGTGPGTTRR